tara:strand:- start:17802 stop:19001 length:1200 start_codon:yes stop_codon:yes gene_type:complete
MSYSDIIGATRLYGDLLNTNFANTANNLSNVKMDYAPVNPYSSGAYTPRSSRNIYTGEGRVTPNPVAEASNLDLSKIEKAGLGVTQGLQYAGIAKSLSPYLQKAGTSLGAKGTMGSLAPAALLYGATRNQNPYDWTRGESLGTIGSTMLAAKSLAPMLGLTAAAAPATVAAAPLLTPLTSSIGAGSGASILGMHPGLALGALLLGGMFSKKGKKAAKKRRMEVKKNIEEHQEGIYTDREAAVREGREDMQSALTKQMYDQRQGRYDNQYGGNYRGYSMDEGGKMDIVAEFTGNELIVNDQNMVEQGLASGNYAMAATPIRKAMKNKQLTPGPETHQGNPMPVDSEGNIYAGGGALPFKANKGAGIYDHATDQFKSNMTDKEIAMVAKKNIKKWESNGMA